MRLPSRCLRYKSSTRELSALQPSANDRSSGSDGGGRWPATQHDYDDIPGTFVFDAERSRQGYGINMFCMSLMKDENRKAFKANEAEYLKKFQLTAGAARRHPQARLQPDARARRQHLFHRQARRDRRPFVPALAAVMTGSTQQDYAKMMLAGGRSVEGNRSKSGKRQAAARSRRPSQSQSRKAKSKSKSSAKRK